MLCAFTPTGRRLKSVYDGFGVANDFIQSLVQLNYVFKALMPTAEVWKWIVSLKPQLFHGFRLK